MADKITARFLNNSGKGIAIVIFEVTKDTSGKETGKVVFAGGIPPHGYANVELDNTIKPWALIADQNYKVGDVFDVKKESTPVDLGQFNGGSYDVGYW